MQASPVHTSTQQEDKQAGEHQVSNIGVDCSSNARPAEIRPCTTVACRVCVVVMQEAGTLNRTGQQLSPPWMVSTYAGCTAQPEDADPVEGHEHPVEPQRTAWCRSPSRATHACASMDHPLTLHTMCGHSPSPGRRCLLGQGHAFSRGPPAPRVSQVYACAGARSGPFSLWALPSRMCPHPSIDAGLCNREPEGVDRVRPPLPPALHLRVAGEEDHLPLLRVAHELPGPVTLPTHET